MAYKKLDSKRHHMLAKRRFEAQENNLCRRLYIARPLDPEQARELRSQLHKIGSVPTATTIRGESGSQEPTLMIVGSRESEPWGFLRQYTADEVINKITSDIPSLLEPATATIKNIGRFGFNASRAAIGAALEVNGGAQDERGSVQAVLCELNHWNPVGMYTRFHPHASLADLPSVTPDEEMRAYKNSVAAVIEPGTTLQFGPAVILTS